MISYLGRSDYSACVLEIIRETGAPRATAGMVSSAFALCNAVGQLASGFVLKKIAPVKVIGAELFAVALINLLFPNTDSFLLMAILWGINGCMQSTLLCGSTQIFVETLEEPYLSRGAVLLNTIGAIGGVLNYLLSWALIRYASWKAVFLTVSTMLFLLGIFWALKMPSLIARNRKMPDKGSADENTQASSADLQLTHYGALFVIIGAFFVGFLRESVALWIPSYMNEVFGLSSSLSTAVTAFVPCLQVCGALLAGRIGRHAWNLHFPSAFSFLCSGICLFLLLLSPIAGPAVTILLFVINAISMTAALTFLLSLFPIRFFGRGQAPILVGVINFFVHTGDFFSSSGIGWLSQTSGWQLTFGILGGLAFTAAVICLTGGWICKKEMECKHDKRYLRE